MSQWLTTAPSPGAPGTGHNAGQQGWKLHAVEAKAEEEFKAIASRRALCGLLPRYGWGLDLFVTDHCATCKRASARIAQRLAQ